MEDERDYMLGLYVRQALQSTVCNAEFWRKKHTKPYQYPKEPFLHNIDIKPLTAEEKKKRTESFFLQLETMQKNFERAKKQSG